MKTLLPTITAQVQRLLPTRRRKVIAALLIIALLLAASCSPNGSQEPKQHLPEVTVVPIVPGLHQTLTTTGTVEANASATFLADAVSTVQSKEVEIGDTVKQGQLIAVLQAKEVAEELRTAKAVHTQTVQSLTQTRITAQQAVQEAQIALKTANINLEKLQKETAAKRIQAVETRNAAKLNFDLSIDSAKTALENQIRTTQTTVKDALTDADDLLEYSPVQEGLTFTKETHLGVRDPAHKLKTFDALNLSYSALATFKPTYEESIALLNRTEGALQMVLTVLQNSVSSPEYTQVTINQNFDNINGHIAALRTVESNLNTAKRSLDTARKKRGTTSQVLIDASAAYESTIAALDAGLARAELDVERAKTALDSAIASAAANEIGARSTLESAKGSLNQAQILQDKLEIRAPFAGRVQQFPIRIGQELQPGQLVAAVEDATRSKIVTFVSSNQIESIAPGQTVVVDGKHTETVYSVSPSADPQTQKYRVELSANAALLPGQFVDVDIALVKDVQDVSALYVPVTAVHIEAAQTYVWLLSTEGAFPNASRDIFSAVKRTVQIGTVEGKFVEILSGVKQKELLITEGGRAITTNNQPVRLHSLPTTR